MTETAVPREIDPKAYAHACPCGAQPGEPCPHTPIRCEHDWLYGENPQWKTRQEPQRISGVIRECLFCGLKQQARMVWEPTP